MGRAVCLGLILLCSCRPEPAFHFQLEFPSGFGSQDVELEVQVYMPGQKFDVSCDNIAYGDTTVEALEASLVLTKNLDNTGSIGDLPRLGDKIFYFQGRPSSTLVEEHQIDPETPLVVGCLELGDIQDHTEHTVQLEETVRLLHRVLTESGQTARDLVAYVPWQGVATTENQFQITLKNAIGQAPVEKTELRATVTGPSGGPFSQTYLSTSSGEVSYQPEVRFVGPFVVRLTPRHALNPSPVQQLGLAVPLDRTLTPFALGAEGPLWWAAPAKLGSGVGYIGFSGMASRRLRSSVARWDTQNNSVSWQETQIEVSDLCPATICSSSDSLVFAGSARTPEYQHPHVVLLQPTSSVFTVGRNYLLAVGDPAAQYKPIKIDLGSTPRNMKITAVPVGLCVGEDFEHAAVDATPLALSVETASPTETHTFLADVVPLSASGPEEVLAQQIDLVALSARARVHSSYCVQSEDNSTHRIIAMTYTTVTGRSVYLLVDLGRGVLDSNQTLTALPVDNSDLIKSMAQFTDLDGNHKLLAQTDESGVLQLKVLGLLENPDRHLTVSKLFTYDDAIPIAYGMPYFNSMVVGDFLAPGSRDLVALQYSQANSGTLLMTTGLWTRTANSDPVSGYLTLYGEDSRKAMFLPVALQGQPDVLLMRRVTEEGQQIMEIGRLGEW